MNGRDAKREALKALDFMAQPGNWPSAGFGYAWNTLAAIAGQPNRKLPDSVFAGGPDKRPGGSK